MKPSASVFSAQALALAATFGLSLTGPHRALAAPVAPIAQSDSGIAVTILSPVPRTTFSGVKPVEISAFYQGSSSNQIVTLELYVDGVKAAQKTLETPETRGVVSFLVDASALTGGVHRIVVRATGADAEVVSAKGSFIFEAPAAEEAAPVATPAGPPRLSIESLSSDGKVEGIVKIRIHADDASGKAPYVSLFIDRAFKTLRNYAPYEFEWDTTAYPNGPHTIEAFGYNDAQEVGHAQPLRVIINNPGGRTERRTDLQDAPKTAVLPHAAPVPAHAAPAVKPRRMKAAALARRPAPALLAALPPTRARHQAAHRQQMARLFDLAQKSLILTGTPELSNPFRDDAAAPAMPAVQPKTMTPLTGFKPMPVKPLVMEAPAAPMAEALLAGTPNASPALPSAPHLLQMASSKLAGTGLSSPFLVAPHVPSMKATVSTLTRLGPSQRIVRVTRPLHASALRQSVHVAHFGASLDWLRAAGQTSLQFNSTRLPLERPLSAQGSVLFGPLRQIFEEGGGSLMWQARTGVVIAHSQSKDISLTMGQKTATVNNAAVALDAAPYVNQGRTMVPLSFLKAAMDVDVQYDAATGHLLVTSKN